MRNSKEQAARFANLLMQHGIQPGDRVACPLPRIPELMIVMLGTLRAGAVYQPLFTAFGPNAIEQRIAGSGARLIVTDGANRPKLDEVHGCPPVIATSDPRLGDFDSTPPWPNRPPVLLRSCWAGTTSF
jgi:acetyl-CoA synthetase